MNDIKSRISALKEEGYFREMQTVTADDGSLAIYVIVTFPPKWIVDEEVADKFGVTVQKVGDSFWFCTDINTGFDSVFDAVEYSIDRMKVAEERARMLKEKIQELRDLFEDETVSIEALRTLEFSFQEPKKKRSKAQTKQEEETTDNNEEKAVEG